MCSEADALHFGCGSDPTMQKQILESITKSIDNKILQGFTWSRPTPVMQQTAQGSMYIEYVVLARGATCTIPDMPLWLGTFPAYLPKSQRYACELLSHPECTVCPTSLWARSTCCTHLTQPEKNELVGERADALALEAFEMAHLLGEDVLAAVGVSSTRGLARTDACIELSDTDDDSSGAKTDDEEHAGASAVVAQLTTSSRQSGLFT